MQRIIAYVTTDLMFHSRVSQTVKSVAALETGGKTASEEPLTLIVNKDASNVIDRIKSLGEAAQLKLVLLDLSTKGLDVSKAVELFRTFCPNAPVYAYGPHVDKSLLERAAATDQTVVLTKGQFDHQMHAIIAEHA
jgi:CheY-like chemotaxis protein